MFKLKPIDNSPTVIEIAELISKNDKIKLIDNVPSLEKTQKALSDQVKHIAEMKARGEEPLRIVDYTDIHPLIGKTPTGKARDHLRKFIGDNHICIIDSLSMIADDHKTIDIDSTFTINKQEDVHDHKLQLTIQKKRIKPSNLLVSLINNIKKFD